MKTAVITDMGRIEILEVDPPEISNSDDVLLKIRGVGICGSDVHYYKHGRIGDQEISYPFRPGHECAAEIVETGSRVAGLKPGDRVAVDPLISCGSCEQCKSGREHTCLNQRFLGAPGQAPGAFAEYTVIPRKCCFKIPAGFSWNPAIFIEPLSIGIYSVDFILPHQDNSVAILGCGPIGLSALIAAKYAGYKRIYVTEKLQYRIDLAKKLGALDGFNILEDDMSQMIRHYEPHGLDSVIECCGEQDACSQGIDVLKPGGKLIVAGIPSINKLFFNPHQLRRKEISIHHVRRQNNCTERAIEIADHPQFPIQELITHEFRLEETSHAFELVAGYRDGVIKAVVTL